MKKVKEGCSCRKCVGKTSELRLKETNAEQSFTSYHGGCYIKALPVYNLLK